MRILHELLHGSPPDGAAPPLPDRADYCTPACAHGRRDDGALMVACDGCDNWFHVRALRGEPSAPARRRA